MLMTSVVFWVITRRRLVIVYRRFGTTYGLFGIYLSSFILVFSSFTVFLFHTCLSNYLSCLLSRYPQQLYVVCIHPSLTLLAVITSHVFLPRRTCQNLRYRRSFLLGLLTREDGTDTLSRNVSKQLPLDAM
jgi:hypothetical protein